MGREVSAAGVHRRAEGVGGVTVGGGGNSGGQRLEGVIGCTGPLRPEGCAGVGIGG